MTGFVGTATVAVHLPSQWLAKDTECRVWKYWGKAQSDLVLGGASVSAAGVLLVPFALHVCLCVLNQPGFLWIEPLVKPHAQASPGALHWQCLQKIPQQLAFCTC